jgi:hypothetical protein
MPFAVIVPSVTAGVWSSSTVVSAWSDMVGHVTDGAGTGSAPSRR